MVILIPLLLTNLNIFINMAYNSKYLIGKKSYFGAETDNKYETFAKGIDVAINASAASYENKGGLLPGGVAFNDTTTTSTTTTTTTAAPTTSTTTTTTTI